MFAVSLGLLVLILPWTVLTIVPGSPFISVGESVTYVTFISHVAIIYACLSTIQSAQVELKQDELERERKSEHSADLDEVERKVEEVHGEVVNGTGSTNG